MGDPARKGRPADRDRDRERPRDRERDREREREREKKEPPKKPGAKSSARPKTPSSRGVESAKKAPGRDGSAQAPLVGALIAVVVVGVLFFQFGGFLPASWVEFADPAAGFSVLAPGPVVAKEEVVDGKDGNRITVHIYVCEDERLHRAYSANYTDYPEAVFTKSVDEILNGARDGTVEKIKGKLQDTRNVFLQNTYPGRELTAEVEGAVVKSRIYVVKRRLYQTIVVVPVADRNSPDIDRFLDSFTIRS